MHQIKYTEQGYSYVPVTIQDCISWGGLGVCNSCGQVSLRGNLVFVLGDYYCPECFNEWQGRAHKYPEDLAYQKQHHLDWYKYHVKDVVDNENKN